MMGRARALLAAGLLLTVAPVWRASVPAHAAGGFGIAASDFTKSTPANAVVFASVQATAADQMTNLSALESAVAGKVNLTDLVGSGTKGMQGADLANAAAKLETALAGIFNGETAVAVLLLLDTLERGKGTSIIGVAAEGTPAALGTVLPADLPAGSQPYREHVRTLDLFAAPGHESALGPVLEALLVRADVLPGVRRLNSVVDAGNTAVRATLEEAGFEQAGILHEFVALGNSRADAVFYELTREEPAPSAESSVSGLPAG